MRLKLKLLCLMWFCSNLLLAQEKTISGTITDAETSEPLIGAFVKVKGVDIGSITDIEGAYKIDVPENLNTLIFSYTGYQSQEITIGTQTTIDVKLAVGKNLEEVVVVGYQTKKKVDLTGAVEVVDMEEIGKMPYANVLQSLQGRVSGVNIIQDGQPGEGRTQIRIRGITTLNNNNPLFVIDGIPSVENLSNLNPNDIESIQVLKDAAAASIYGSRSAGGVVVITTKKGRKGKLNVDAGVLNGIQTTANKVDVLNAAQWGEVYWQAFQNTFPNAEPQHPLYGRGQVPVISTLPFLTPNGRQIYQFDATGTDWHDEVFQDALQQQYYVNISSGNDRGNVLFGVSYFDQEGMIQKTYYDRITGRLNSEMKITDWLKIGENLSVSFSEQVQIGSQQGQDGIPLDVIRQHPLLPVRALDGTYAGKIAGFPDVRNMVSILEKNENNTTDSWRVFGNAYIAANVFDAIPSLREKHDLILKSSLGIDYSNFYDVRFNAAFQEGDFDVQENSLYNGFGAGLTTTWINTLQYNFETGSHAVTFLGGMEAVDYNFKFLNGLRTGFEIETPDFTVLSAGSGDQVNAGGGTEWGLLSYFGKVDYVYDDKYLLSGTLRYDRTSRLNTDGIFPAVSLGWRLGQEKFVQDAFAESGIVSDAKIRLSYGEQGNQNIADFATISVFGADQNHADYDLSGTNNGVSQGYRVISKGNPNLVWETTSQYNFGIDLNLFDYKVDLTFDYFRKETKDILLRSPQIAALGEGDFPFVNAAIVSNNGFDLSIGYTHPTTNDFSFSAQLQVTKFNNEVTSLGENIANIGNEGEEYINGSDGPTRIAIGQPIGAFYGYIVDGIFQTAEEAQNAPDQGGGNGIGRLRYRDINSDSIINELDRTYIGAPYPDYSLGLNLSATYKDITLSAFLYAGLGQEVYNEILWYTDFAQNGNFNRGTRILDAWSPSNTGSTIPAPTLNNNNNENRPSSYFVEEASYLRLRTVRLGYTLPENWTKNYNVNIYTEVQNAFTISDYSGVDPEVPYAGNSNFPGIDRGVYPLPRTFLVGINVKY